MIYYDNREFDTEQKYELYLINKYLTNRYNKETSRALLHANANNLNKLAISIGKEDISFFCLFFLSDIFVVKDTNEARELSKDHYDLWNIANNCFIKDEYDKLNIVCPRGFAKTTIFDLAVSIWLIVYQKSKFTLIGAKKDDDATQFVDNIKKVFLENKKIINTFGELINKKEFKVNANEIEFTNGMYIRAVGSASSVRGATFKGIRPTVVIADDYQDEKDILTEEARDKKYNRWTKEIEQVGDKAVYRNGKKIKQATKIINIGTVLHIDCLVSRLSRNNDYYTVIKRAVILEPNQTIDDIFDTKEWRQCKKLYYNDRDKNSKNTANNYYLKHKDIMKFPVLWEEKWDCFNDIAIPYWENRNAFMSELMNDATNIGTKWFRSVRTEPKDYIENNDFIKTALVIDPASTTNKTSDFTSMTVASTTANNFLWIRDIVLEKLEFEEYCKKVVEKLIDYEDITHIIIEKNTFQGADVLKIKELIDKEPRLKNRRFEFINKMQRKNKDEKISTIVDAVNNGQIIFIDNNKEAIEQLLNFCGQQYSVHDDFPDCVAEAYIKIKEIKGNNKITLLDRSCLF